MPEKVGELQQKEERVKVENGSYPKPGKVVNVSSRNAIDECCDVP